MVWEIKIWLKLRCVVFLISRWKHYVLCVKGSFWSQCLVLLSQDAPLVVVVRLKRLVEVCVASKIDDKTS